MINGYSPIVTMPSDERVILYYKHKERDIAGFRIGKWCSIFKRYDTDYNARIVDMWMGLQDPVAWAPIRSVDSLDE